MEQLPPEELLIHTLDLLEFRLQRLEYIFNGGDAESTLPKGTTVVARLNKLQHELGQLAAKSRGVEQLLKLQAKHPDLFRPDTPQNPSSPTHEQKLHLVLAEAPTLLSIASQLRALHDVPLPPTSSFTHLVSQTPRFAAIQTRQEIQAREIAELRRRSALLVTRWYEGHVLGAGRCWADWEGRMGRVERGVRRAELASEVD